MATVVLYRKGWRVNADQEAIAKNLDRCDYCYVQHRSGFFTAAVAIGGEKWDWTAEASDWEWMLGAITRIAADRNTPLTYHLAAWLTYWLRQLAMEVDQQWQ